MRATVKKEWKVDQEVEEYLGRSTVVRKLPQIKTLARNF